VVVIGERHLRHHPAVVADVQVELAVLTDPVHPW
jgi:hypothetical protein